MGRDLRVLYLIDKMSLGGAQTHLDTVVRNIGSFQVAPVLCCLNDLGSLAVALKADGFQVVDLQIKRLLSETGVKGALQLARLIKTEQFDLVHAYLFSSNVMAPVAARLARTPVLTSRRDTGFWAARKHWTAYRWVNRWTHAITVNSEAVRQSTLKHEGKCADKIHLVRNGIHPRPLCRNGHCNHIGTVGNLKPVKGHATLIRAFGLLAAEYKDLSLHLYGSGPEKMRLQHTAGAVGLNGEVRIQSGQLSAQVLENLDIFVLPSRSEGCSNALLEAMASGLPVVATDIAANRELIQDKVNGLLVPVGDYRAMARAIQSLVESPEKRAGLGQAAIQAAEHFSVEVMLSQMRQVYDKVLEAAEARRR